MDYLYLTPVCKLGRTFVRSLICNASLLCICFAIAKRKQDGNSKSSHVLQLKPWTKWPSIHCYHERMRRTSTEMLAARMISVFVSSCLSQLVADVRYFTTPPPPPPPPPPALLSWLRKHLTTVVFHHQQDLAISFLRVAVIKKGVKFASRSTRNMCWSELIISRSYCAKLKDCTHPTLRSNFSSPFS